VERTGAHWRLRGAVPIEIRPVGTQAGRGRPHPTAAAARRIASVRTGASAVPPRRAPQRTGAHWRASAKRAGAHWQTPGDTPRDASANVPYIHACGSAKTRRWPGAGSESWNMLTYPLGCGQVPAVASQRIRSAPAPPMHSKRKHDLIMLMMYIITIIYSRI
jgi:hypothetical protein